MAKNEYDTGFGRMVETHLSERRFDFVNKIAFGTKNILMMIFYDVQL